MPNARKRRNVSLTDLEKQLLRQGSLDFIRNKGNCNYTLRRAINALKAVRWVFSEKEYLDIYIALDHVEIGEGPSELNDVIKKIIA